MKNGVVSSHSCFSKEFVFSCCSLRQWTRVQKGRTDAPLDLWLNIGWRDPHFSLFSLKKFNQKIVFIRFPSDVVFWNTNGLVKLSICSYRTIKIQGNHLECFEYKPRSTSACAPGQSKFTKYHHIVSIPTFLFGLTYENRLWRCCDIPIWKRFKERVLSVRINLK